MIASTVLPITTKTLPISDLVRVNLLQDYRQTYANLLDESRVIIHALHEDCH